jgi:hypothetical protein
VCILKKIPDEGVLNHFKPEGVEGMASNVRKSGSNDNQMSRTVSVIAWIACIAGIILILLDIGNLTDRNIYLMTGIGCVVAGIFIFLVGKSFVIARKKEDQENGRS